MMLAGCAAPASQTAGEINLSGYSVPFKQGYADGCNTARGPGARKDEARYRRDADYMMGWNDGYGICGKHRR